MALFMLRISTILSMEELANNSLLYQNNTDLKYPLYDNISHNIQESTGLNITSVSNVQNSDSSFFFTNHSNVPFASALQGNEWKNTNTKNILDVNVTENLDFNKSEKSEELSTSATDLLQKQDINIAQPVSDYLEFINEQEDKENSNTNRNISSLNMNKKASDFEYYDFLAPKERDPIPPPLTSYSLVSPIPLPKNRKKTNITQNISNDLMNQQNTSNGLTNQKNITENRTLNRTLNTGNPYPYGPIVLPDNAEVKHSVDPETISSTISPVTIPTTELLTPNSVENVDDYEYHYESYEYDAQTHEVHTEKPTVLFHFDGPGYMPEAPSTKPPPVRAPTPSDPWNCSMKCPNYTLEDWNSFYEVRRYPKMTWLSTIIINKERVLAELEGYMRIQDYFFGLNDRGLTMNLSVPFITQIKQGKHPGVVTEISDHTISLHVPPDAIQEAYGMPAPISNEILIDTLEPKTVFVSSFKIDIWEVTNEFLENKAQLLMEKLRSNGEAFIDRYFYLASYSRPELYQPVYYEIWIYATTLRTPKVQPPEPMPRPRMPPLSKITQDTVQKLCRGVECPSFEVVRAYKYGIQKRRYYDVMFASVSTGDCYFSTLSVWRGFMPLHLYKHGMNSQMEVIEATRPIAVVKVAEDSTSNTECPQNLTMSLFLPRRLHSAPPVTGYTAPGPIEITSMEDVMVYAYTIGGYLMDQDRIRRELSDFKYRLLEFGACYREDVYYVVIYDFISRYHGRQNEIWLVAENCRATMNGK